MNRLRHYATYGNTRDFQPEDEEKPLKEYTPVTQAFLDQERGKCIYFDFAFTIYFFFNFN
jgi:hypothetical protein